MANTTTLTFGQLVKDQRKALDLTQRQLGNLVGCAEDTIRKIEADRRRPSRQVAQLLAEALQIEAAQKPIFLRLARDEAAATTPTAAESAPPALAPSTPRLWGLAAPVTALLGRETALSEIHARLDLPQVRLLTLLGSGGAGKTRLALAVAFTRQNKYPDGAVVVSLAALAELDAVLPTIADGLGVHDQAGETLFDRVVTVNRSKQMLLVLDNFEQIVAAAPLVADLLAACPQLQVLVTSRVALRIRGEHEYTVPPLIVPDLASPSSAADLLDYPAVALFVERIRAVQPDFAVTPANAPIIAELCVRLDGLPLALELAAARIKLLSPQSMLARLNDRFALLSGGMRDLPKRQQSLRATLAWSYDLLGANEQQLLARMSVFAGGASFDAIAAVAAPTTELDVTFDGVTTLLESSLVYRAMIEDEPRFAMLETVREYAREQLERGGETTQAQHQHARYFLEFAEANRLNLRSNEQTQWIERFARENDNVRLALHWMHDQHEWELLVRMCGALWYFWYLASDYSTAMRWLDAALVGYEQAPVQYHALLLEGASAILHEVSQFDRALDYGQRCLELRRQASEPERTAAILNNLATVAADLNQLNLAQTYYEEGAQILQKLGNQRGHAMIIHNLSQLAIMQSDWVEARRLLDQALPMFRASDDGAGTFLALHSLGMVAVEQGERSVAQHYLGEALAYTLASRGYYGAPELCETIAALALAYNQPERAARMWGATEHQREVVGCPIQSVEQTVYTLYLQRLHAALQPTHIASLWREGRSWSLGQMLAYAAETLGNAHEKDEG